MPNILHTQLKYDIVTYNLNVYKTSSNGLSYFIIERTQMITFQNQVLSILKMCSPNITLLRKIKTVTNSKH